MDGLEKGTQVPTTGVVTGGDVTLAAVKTIAFDELRTLVLTTLVEAPLKATLGADNKVATTISLGAVSGVDVLGLIATLGDALVADAKQLTNHAL